MLTDNSLSTVILFIYFSFCFLCHRIKEIADFFDVGYNHCIDEKLFETEKDYPVCVCVCVCVCMYVYMTYVCAVCHAYHHHFNHQCRKIVILAAVPEFLQQHVIPQF